MSQPIKEIIEALDKNIKGLEEVKEINLIDVKTLLIDLFGTIRDMWEGLRDIFIKVEKISIINTPTIIKGEIVKKNFSEEAGRLYQ